MGFLIHNHGPIEAHLDNQVLNGEEGGRRGGFHMPFPDENLGEKKGVRDVWPWFTELLGQAS